MSDLTTKLVFITDETAKKKAVNALQGVSKAQKQSGIEANKANAFYDRVAKGNKQVAQSSEALVSALRKEANAVTDASDSYKKLADSKKTASEFDRGAFGDVDTSFAAIGGIASTAGLGGAGEGLGILGEVTALGEELPRLKDAFGGIAQAVGNSGLGSAIQSVIPGLSSATVGAGLLAGAFVAVTAVIGVVSVALGEFNKAQEEASRLTLAQAEAIRTVNDLQREGLTTESAQARVDALLQELQDRQEELARFNADYAATIATDSENIFRGIEEAIVRVFDGNEDAIVANIATTQEAIDALNLEIAELDATIASGELTVNDFVAAEEALAEVRQESTAKIEAELAQAESQRASSLQRISALEASRVAFLEQADQNASDRAEDLALSTQFENEDREARFKAHNASLVAIEAEGQATIEGIRGELNKLPAERFKALVGAEDKANKAIATLQTDYMSSEMERLKKFQTDEARVVQRADIERLRAVQDLNDTLNDAQRENNVIAFLQAQRDGQKELTRTAQDLDEASKQRTADFGAETQARQQALQERIADIRTNLAQEQTEIRASFDLKRAELAKSIDDEKAAIQARTETAVASYKAELAAQAQRDERQAQRDAIAEQRRARAHEAQLARIDEQTRAEQSALSAIMATINSLSAGVRGGNMATGASTNSLNIISKRPNKRGGNGAFAFEGGGIVDRPTLALLGEGKKPEAIIPFAPSEGIGRAVSRLGLGGSSAPIFAPQFNVQVGDIASRGEVSQALDNYSQALMGNLATFLQTAQAGGAR